MNPNAPSVSKLLQSESSALQRLFVKAKHLAQLNELLQKNVDEKLRGRCLVANLNEDKLVVLAENAALVTLFRFVTPELIIKLRGKHPLLKELKQIECKVKHTTTE